MYGYWRKQNKMLDKDILYFWANFLFILFLCTYLQFIQIITENPSFEFQVVFVNISGKLLMIKP